MDNFYVHNFNSKDLIYVIGQFVRLWITIIEQFMHGIRLLKV